jgi:hypothetical protein
VHGDLCRVRRDARQHVARLMHIQVVVSWCSANMTGLKLNNGMTA